MPLARFGQRLKSNPVPLYAARLNFTVEMKLLTGVDDTTLEVVKGVALYGF
jgi:hypothetical protein